MAITLHAAVGHLELHGPLAGGPLRRVLDEPAVAPLRIYGERYRRLVGQRPTDAAALLALGRELYDWLNGEQGWLRQLRQVVTADFGLELRGPLEPDDVEWAVLNAPWELLADEKGFLAEDIILGFAPVRRLGQPKASPPLDAYRLGVAFMASTPRGVVDLDFEHEERAILTAIDPKLGIDLLVEDSGDPSELRLRLGELSTFQVLHLSCHGHNAWRPRDQLGAASQPVLMMEDHQGDERPTTAAALLSEMAPYQPRLLFLSACLSAAGVGDGDAIGGVADSLATVLVRGGTPAVLGWDGSVSDVAATRFARVLYKELGNRRPPAAAVAVARQVLLATKPEGSPGEDVANPDGQLAAEREAVRRDWHMARLWLGPEGGGPLVVGTKKRSLLPADHGHKRLLKARQAASEVAAPEMFVGRRRELQNARRALAGTEHAGVLLHGLGRLGKSSLAAHIASRHRDLILAVTFGNYDALSVLDDLIEALEDHRPAYDLLVRARVEIGEAALFERPQLLRRWLIDLLTGPCSQKPDGWPVMLLIDDLEQILVADPAGRRHRVRDAERPVLAAVLRAFAPGRSDSRLLLTSRFTFTLVDEHGDELAGRLVEQHLGLLNDSEREKLSRRQVEMAKLSDTQRKSASEAEMQHHLLARAQGLSQGIPGLQDLLGRKIVLDPAVSTATAEATLDAVQAWLDGGALPEAVEVRAFLENLALQTMLDLAGDGGRALLRAATLFERPVPIVAFEVLAAKVGGSFPRLVDLGLLDRFEDLVDPRTPAFAVTSLLGRRLGPLSEAEACTLGAIALPGLFRVWGGADKRPRPVVTNHELARLGLLAGSVEVVTACAGDTVRGLFESHDYREAAALGGAALALLDAESQPPPLNLLLPLVDALWRLGELVRVDVLLERVADQLADPEKAGSGSDSTEQRALLFRQGRRYYAASRLDEAQAKFTRMAELAVAAGDLHDLANARGRIADILVARGELDEALRVRQLEELPTFERLGDLRNVAVTKGRIADILVARGELDEAMRVRQHEELPIFERLGDVRGIAITKGKLADIFVIRGMLDEALRIRLEDELPIFLRLGDVREIAGAYRKVAEIIRIRGHVDEALRLLREEALPRAQQFESTRDTAAYQGQIADILIEFGKLDEALRVVRDEALPNAERASDVKLIAALQGRIADILEARDRCNEEALRIRQQEVLPVFERFNDVHAIAVTKGKIADLLEARDQRDEALRILEQEVLPIFERLHDVREIAITKGRIADIFFARGEFDEARELQEERLAINRDHRFLSGIAGALWDLALIDLRQDKRPDALHRLAKAYELVLQLDRTEGIAAIGAVLGQMLASFSKRGGEALEVLNRSAAAYRQLGRAEQADQVEILIRQLDVGGDTA